jgi:hypothetical protein
LLDFAMPSFANAFRRGFVAIAATLALAAFSIRPAIAAPYDYTDSWYAGPAEAGWGVNFTQSDDFIFATLFIYGPQSPGQPTWYTAQMTWDGQSQFVGGLYATTGTFYANPWNPNNSTNTQVGVASFTPSTQNNYEGTFSYTVNGVGTVTKALTRLTLTPILLAGSYAGGQSGSYSNCTAPASNRTYQDFFTSQVTQNGTNVTMTFVYSGGQNPLTCTISGALLQNGLIYRIPNASYSCSDGMQTTASVSDLRATPLGIEGQFSAASVGAGCRETARFGGVLN